ncbi:hypothetical protein [Hyalangium rubrum]|uniref:Uncharacterized protein n=1 Tax=Hyalangium rubrum TaxID=3103134 RepID=A0ABU5HE16_9BACT|nr:hypothetical protein [Hyalangium sp. s54d21]MDY7231354.1 hypothetical protein [Hyalangium sp. s54d21]
MSGHGEARRVLAAVALLALPGLASAQPETHIVRAPPCVTESRLTEFEFESDDPKARFECRLDGHGFYPCERVLRLYARISAGAHILEVRALVDEALVDPSPAAYAWEVREAPLAQPLIAPLEEAGCSGAGGSPALFLIGLFALVALKTRVSSRT